MVFGRCDRVQTVPQGQGLIRGRGVRSSQHPARGQEGNRLGQPDLHNKPLHLRRRATAASMTTVTTVWFGQLRAAWRLVRCLPLASTGFMNWRSSGKGRWISVYTNAGPCATDRGRAAV